MKNIRPTIETYARGHTPHGQAGENIIRFDRYQTAPGDQGERWVADCPGRGDSLRIKTVTKRSQIIGFEWVLVQ